MQLTNICFLKNAQTISKHVLVYLFLNIVLIFMRFTIDVTDFTGVESLR